MNSKETSYESDSIFKNVNSAFTRRFYLSIRSQKQSVLAPKEFGKLSGFRETVVRSNHRIPVGGQTLLLPDVLFLVESGPVNNR